MNKCYNEDAMVFSQQVKNYKVNARFVKSVGAEVLSLGFPVSEVEKGNMFFGKFKNVLRSENYSEENKKVWGHKNHFINLIYTLFDYIPLTLWNMLRIPQG